MDVHSIHVEPHNATSSSCVAFIGFTSSMGQLFKRQSSLQTIRKCVWITCRLSCLLLSLLLLVVCWCIEWQIRNKRPTNEAKTKNKKKWHKSIFHCGYLSLNGHCFWWRNSRGNNLHIFLPTGSTAELTQTLRKSQTQPSLAIPVGKKQRKHTHTENDDDDDQQSVREKQ